MKKAGDEKKGRIKRQVQRYHLKDGIRIHHGDDLFSPSRTTSFSVTRSIWISYKREKMIKDARKEHKELRERLDRINSRIAEERQLARSSRPISPPAIAESLLIMFTPVKQQDNLLGCLREQFEADVLDLGLKGAHRRYVSRVTQSVMPLLWLRLQKIGVIAFLVDLGRRKLGL